MKKVFVLSVFVSLFIVSCGGKEEAPSSTTTSTEQGAPKLDAPEVQTASDDPMQNKGIGPVQNLEIPETIDLELAEEGRVIYEAKCTACHKPSERYIGPAPKGLLDRRSPEWAMNMILNPEEMTAKDPIAKQLLIEFNGSPMANQGLTEDDARAVLEYIRTIE